jgi:uncharacterized protein YutE (UPF0331/DUF86 family)
MDTAMILRKAVQPDGYLNDLRDIAPQSFDEYNAKPALRYASERLLELIVECASDINSELIFAARLPSVDRYYDQFMRLSDIGLVKAALAKQLAPFAGLRNRLVHDYEDIDHQIVFNNIGRAFKLFPQYLAAVHQRITDGVEANREVPGE